MRFYSEQFTVWNTFLSKHTNCFKSEIHKILIHSCPCGSLYSIGILWFSLFFFAELLAIHTTVLKLKSHCGERKRCEFGAVQTVPLKMHCQVMVRKTKPRRVGSIWTLQRGRIVNFLLESAEQIFWCCLTTEKKTECSNLLISNSFQKWNSAIIAAVLIGTAGPMFGWGLFGIIFFF